jgi:hypothetical protein
MEDTNELNGRKLNTTPSEGAIKGRVNEAQNDMGVDITQRSIKHRAHREDTEGTEKRSTLRALCVLSVNSV